MGVDPVTNQTALNKFDARSYAAEQAFLAYHREIDAAYAAFLKDGNDSEHARYVICARLRLVAALDAMRG